MSFFIGTGSTITFSSGFFAEIIDISPPNLSRESVPTFHMGTTTAQTHAPVVLFDPGELTVEMAFDPKTKPPINGAEESIVITFPNSAASTWTFLGFMTGFEPTDPLEDRMLATATVKATGDITVA